MVATIDEYLCISIADIKRLGYLNPNTVCQGVVTWNRGGRKAAEVTMRVKTTGVPFVSFGYSYKGTPTRQDVPLRWKRSNLNPESEHGYYYFVCPDTGALCRKLYIVDGRFVSRRAFKPLYDAQTKSKAYRELNNTYGLLFQYDEIQRQRYRRETYRGKLTPYGRKVMKLARRLGAYLKVDTEALAAQLGINPI